MTDKSVTDALARRSFERQAGFLSHVLRSRQAILDCGCGPGSITCDLAERVKPGKVTGIDIDDRRLEVARQSATDRKLVNVVFQPASIYELPFNAGSFDLVFAHGVFQHLSDPATALQEISRVLVPGGIVALRSPDWGALMLAPRTRELTAAFADFLSTYYEHGDAYAGGNGPRLVRQAGFRDVSFTVTLEHEDPAGLGSFAASKLNSLQHTRSAEHLREWGADLDASFAQCWGETVAYNP